MKAKPRRRLLGALGCLWILASIGYGGYWVLSWVYEPVYAVNCLSNLKQIGQAHLAYAADHDDRFTPASRWMTNLKKVEPFRSRPEMLQCPDPREREPGYAMAIRMSARARSSIRNPSEEVLTFEVNGRSPNQSGDPRSAARFHPSYQFGFADGSVGKREGRQRPVK